MGIGLSVPRGACPVTIHVTHRSIVDNPTKILVDAGGLSPNTWKQLERLSAAWEQTKPGIRREEPRAAEPEAGVVLTPMRRARTPLTEAEVDAIRTARSDGQSASTIAKRLKIHRGTVWEKVRGNASPKPVRQARPDHSTPPRTPSDG